MVEVIAVVRNVGRLMPNRFQRLVLPDIPAVGSYISLQGADGTSPTGEDLIVRQVWWRVRCSPDAPSASQTAGSLKEIFLECDPAIGPYSSTEWRQSLGNNPEIEVFEAARADAIRPPPDWDAAARPENAPEQEEQYCTQRLPDVDIIETCLLHLVSKRGNQGNSADLFAALADQFNVNTCRHCTKNEDRSRAWESLVQLACQHLVGRGLLEDSHHNVLVLTAQGIVAAQK